MPTILRQSEMDKSSAIRTIDSEILTLEELKKYTYEHSI